MFKVSIPIVKTYTREGKTYVKGIASDSAIDLENERFSDNCVKQMSDAVNKGNVPLRAEHSHFWNQVCGELTSATVDKEGRLEIEAEVDTGMSIGKDLINILNKGVEVGLSVAGLVTKASMEFVESMNKHIRVYDEMALTEISVVSSPANPRTSVSISKSIKAKGFDDKIHGTQDIIIENTKESEELMQKEHTKNLLIAVTKGVSQGESFEDLKKFCDSDCESTASSPLTMQDFTKLLEIITLLQRVQTISELQNPPRPAILDDWEKLEKLRPEAYISLSDGYKTLPHHQENYLLDKALVIYSMSKLIQGEAWSVMDNLSNYYTALSHLHYHLIELNMTKKSKEATKDIVTPTSPTKEDVTISEEGSEVTETKPEVGTETSETETPETKEGEGETAEDESTTPEKGDSEETSDETKEGEGEGESTEKSDIERLSDKVDALANLVTMLAKDKLADSKVEDMPAEAEKSVEKEVVKEVVKAVEKDQSVELEALKKGIDTANSTTATVLEMVVKMAEAVRPRRSVAFENFSVANLTQEFAETQKSFGTSIKTKLDQGMDWQTAYKTTKKEFESQ